MGTIKSFKVKLSDRRSFKANIEFYKSAQDVVEDCRSRAITDSYFKDKSTDSFSKSWEGVDTYDEALDLLKNGYQPTVEQLQESLKSNRIGGGKRITFQNDISGFAPIVPLALKGVPNSMISTTMKPIKCKVVDIYYDMGVSCGTSVETIIENGQTLLSTIIDLEKQGYRFNLYAMQGYTDSNSGDFICVKVKSSDRPLDLKRISFPLTHPAFFRVIGFDWYSKMPIAKYRSGYGCAFTHSVSDSEAKEFAKQVFGDNAVYFSSTSIKNKGEEHIKEVLTNAKNKD